MSNLIVPIFLWNSPPSHEITSALLSTNKTSLFTGSQKGQICIWGLDLKDRERSRLWPRVVLFTNEDSPITALVTAQYDLKDVIVGVSLEGTLTIWSSADGQCLACRQRVFKCVPRFMKLLPDQKRIAVAGYSSDIEILELSSLKVTQRMADPEDWIIALDICRLNNMTVLFTMNAMGTARFWTVDDGSRNSVGPEAHNKDSSLPIQTLCLGVENPIGVSFSPNDNRFVIFNRMYWTLFNVGLSQTVTTIRCPEKTGQIVNAKFVDNNTVVVWTKAGVGYVYSMSAIVHQNSDKQSSKKHSKIDLKLSIFTKGQAPSKSSDLSKDTETPNYIFTLVSEKTSKENFASSNHSSKVLYPFGEVDTFVPDPVILSNFNLFLVCSFDGSIKLWRVFADTIRSKDEMPFLEAHFTDGFERNDPQQPFVTCSNIMESQFVLVLGYNDGTIALRHLPSESTLIAWRAHSAKVNCLLPFKIEQSELLISGSDDFTVKIWNPKNQQLLHKFYNQSGPIESLFLPSETSSQWQHKFFAISSDSTVATYIYDSNPRCQHLFGKHSAPIKEVRWQPSQDYLLVLCADDSVSIWEMSTGHLEGKLCGKKAKEIFNAAKPLSKEDPNQIIKLCSKQAITKYSLSIPREPNIQCLLLNIKLILCTLRSLFKEQTEKEAKDQNDIWWSQPEYQIFTYFLPWEFEEEMDKSMKLDLFLRPPNPEGCFGILGTGAKISVLVPNAMGKRNFSNTAVSASSLAFSRGPRVAQWTTSDTLTAICALASVALAKSLLLLDSSKNVCSQLLSYFCALLPDHIERYVDPSLSYLARFWQDPIDDVMQAARSIFVASLDRLSPDAKKSVAQSWALTLQENSESAKKTKPLSVLVLAILGCECPDCLTPEIVAQVSNELADMLSQDSKLSITTIELLGKGFELWAPHIKESTEIIKRLFRLSMIQEPQSLSTSAQHALMLIGVREPRTFIQTIGQRFKLSQDSLTEAASLDPREHSHALFCIQNLIKKTPNSLVNELPLLVESLVRSLDPHIPHLREACLKPAASLVYDLVRRYPMISFDESTQRLAVGNKQGVIFVYDLTSATRLHTLESHPEKAVTALTFGENGKMLASYCFESCEIKLWRVGTGIFGILNPSVTKSFHVPTQEKQVSSQSLLEGVKLTWSQNPKQLVLIRNWEKVPSFVIPL